MVSIDCLKQEDRLITFSHSLILVLKVVYVYKPYLNTDKFYIIQFTLAFANRIININLEVSYQAYHEFYHEAVAKKPPL